jgi:putative membrane protein
VDSARIGDALALVNASLNGLSAVSLIAGYVFVRRRKLHLHRRAMITALSASGLFLVFYVTRVAFTGTHEFAGEGLAKTVYLTVLFSHMILAVVIVPLVMRLVFLVWKRRFRQHGRLARWTYPIWLYVSLTGLTVYVMLYQVYGYR